MGEGYYGVSDEFIMYVVAPAILMGACLIYKIGEWLSESR